MDRETCIAARVSSSLDIGVVVAAPEVLDLGKTKAQAAAVARTWNTGAEHLATSTQWAGVRLEATMVTRAQAGSALAEVTAGARTANAASGQEGIERDISFDSQRDLWKSLLAPVQLGFCLRRRRQQKHMNTRFTFD